MATSTTHSHVRNARPSQAKAKKGKGSLQKDRSARVAIQELSLNQINDDAELQPRVSLDLDVMREYSQAWLEKAKFPPIDVFFDGETYWLADGFYRVRSARKANLTSIRAYVHDGGKREAMIFSVGANVEHGVRRNREDTRKAILRLLDDPQWCLWSDNEIARACKVGPTTVGRYRQFSSSVKGHNVNFRITGAGYVSESAHADKNQELLPENVPARTFDVPPVIMTRDEILSKFKARIGKEIKKSHKNVSVDHIYRFGKISLVAENMIYEFAVAHTVQAVYQVLGKLLVARHVIGKPDAGITIIGHFPRSMATLISALRSMDVYCLTPEQVLSGEG